MMLESHRSRCSNRETMVSGAMVRAIASGANRNCQPASRSFIDKAASSATSISWPPTCATKCSGRTRYVGQNAEGVGHALAGRYCDGIFNGLKPRGQARAFVAYLQMKIDAADLGVREVTEHSRDRARRQDGVGVDNQYDLTRA